MAAGPARAADRERQNAWRGLLPNCGRASPFNLGQANCEKPKRRWGVMRATRLVSQAAIAIGLATAIAMGSCGGTSDAPRWNISGTVSGAVSQGVSITLGGAASKTTTDASGLYAFSGLSNGSSTVTPSLTGFTVNPASRSVSVSGADVGRQDFIATRLFCAPELTECSGICVDTQNDTASCGSCGGQCNLPHADATCSSGTCNIGTCVSGWRNCDGLDANGCEEPSRCNRCCPKGFVFRMVCYPTVGCHLGCAPPVYGG